MAGLFQRHRPRACPRFRVIRAAPTGIRRHTVPGPVCSISAPGKTTRLSTELKNPSISPGRAFLGGGFSVLAPAPGAPTIGIGRTNPINNWTNEVGFASLKAMDPQTGEEVWSYDQFDVSDSGMLTTASDLLFTGGREGYFHAVDARSGDLLWNVNLGGQIVMAPVTYSVDGVQYVSVISGHALSTFALPN